MNQDDIKMKQVCNANLSTYESQSVEDLIACNADRLWKLMEIYQTCRGSDSFDIAVLKPQVEQAQEGLKALVGQAGLPRRRNSLKEDKKGACIKNSAWTFQLVLVTKISMVLVASSEVFHGYYPMPSNLLVRRFFLLWKCWSVGILLEDTQNTTCLVSLMH